jgi:hypothetical protein
MDQNEGISLHEKVEKIMEKMRRSRGYACLGYHSGGKQDQTTVDDQPLPLKSDRRDVQRHGTVFPKRNRILTDGDRTAPNPLYIAPKSEWEVPASVSLMSPVSSRPLYPPYHHVLQTLLHQAGDGLVRGSILAVVPVTVNI